MRNVTRDDDKKKFEIFFNHANRRFTFKSKNYFITCENSSHHLRPLPLSVKRKFNKILFKFFTKQKKNTPRSDAMRNVFRICGNSFLLEFSYLFFPKQQKKNRQLNKINCINFNRFANNMALKLVNF